MAYPTYTSPSFNSNQIFDCIDFNNNYFSNGTLYVPGYEPITQWIHFEGEVGSYPLHHGYPNLDWSFKGIISGAINGSTNYFNTQINAIQAAIDDGANDNFRTLVDSFGNYYYDNSRVMSLKMTEPHIFEQAYNNVIYYGYFSQVIVTGIVQNNTHIGQAS